MQSFPSVFDYTDFRLFLRDAFKAKHLSQPRFTYGKIGKVVGFASRGYFTQILQGKTKIAKDKIQLFAKAFGLKKRESEYFDLLVRFNQAKSYEEKRKHLEQIVSLSTIKVKTVAPDQYEYYDKWYYSAIRSVLGHFAFQGDYAVLAKRLHPAITSRQARNAIELLKRLGMIEKRADGCYHRKDQFITTGDDIQSVAVVNFQLETMDLAKKAVQTLPKPVRNAVTLTVGLSKQGYEAIAEEIVRFRKRVFEIAKQETKADRVYQVNLHAFPLTNLPQEG